jgi:hypothetical protein
MTHKNSVRPLAWTACVVAGLALGYSQALLAKDEPLPEVSPEGLQLKHDSRDARVVYLKPGATFNQYNRVAILDCYVEFDKNWQRDYNNDRLGLQGRVSTADMDRMKAAVGAEFKKVFTKELQKEGGYEVVDTAAPDVLVLRPAIINLVVTAPDLQTANMTRSVVASAGQMTLYLELWDSATNTILARILDPQADNRMGGMGQMASSVTNTAAADKIFREWAQKLHKHLDAVRGKPAGS